MKKLNILLCTLFALAGMSCTNYLDIKPYGRTIPKTAEEFEALLNNHLNKIDEGSDNILVGNASQYITWDAECGDDFETCLTEHAGRLPHRQFLSRRRSASGQRTHKNRWTAPASGAYISGCSAPAESRRPIPACGC